MSVADYNTDPNSNTSISGINIAEGCPPSGINNAIRQMMADVKAADNANVKLAGNQNISGTKTFASSVIVSGTGTIGFRVDNATATRSVDLRAQDNGNAGIWDWENNRWMIYANVGAVTEIPSGLTTAAPAASDSSTRVPTTAWVGSNAVMLSGNQTIAGTKTFSSMIVASSNYGIGSAADSGYLHFYGGSAFGKGALLNLTGKDYTSGGFFTLRASNGTANKDFVGRPDGTLTWNGQPVQTSSDERLKTPLADIPDAVLDAWGDVGWGQFQYLDAVAEKGAGKARLHLGLIAQRVKAVFDERGLDACKYGILCHEVWDDETDENGNVIQKAGDLWMVRYEEALAMEAAYQRRRADRAEARITTLERRLDEMETVLATLGA